MMFSRWFTIPSLTASLLLLSPLATFALDKCKASLKTGDGTIFVQANDVQGPLLWGNEIGQETNAFQNDATCVADGRARKCTFGDVGTLARITPPPGCTVYLADGVGSCSAYIKKCTPGVRDASQVDANAAAIVDLQSQIDALAASLLPLQCPGLGGVVVGGACWFYGAAAQSCTTVCSDVGLAYDDATRTYAGSGGTDAQCNEVLQALKDAGSPVPNDVNAIDDFAGNNGRGCHAQTAFCPEDIDDPVFSCWLRDVNTTQPGATHSGAERACACKPE